MLESTKRLRSRQILHRPRTMWSLEQARCHVCRGKSLVALTVGSVGATSTPVISTLWFLSYDHGDFHRSSNVTTKKHDEREQAETSVSLFPGVAMVFLSKAVDGRPKPLATVCPQKPPGASEPQRVNSSPLPWRGLLACRKVTDSCCPGRWSQTQWLKASVHDLTILGATNTQVSGQQGRQSSTQDHSLQKPSPTILRSLTCFLPPVTFSDLDLHASY